MVWAMMFCRKKLKNPNLNPLCHFIRKLRILKKFLKAKHLGYSRTFITKTRFFDCHNSDRLSRRLQPHFSNRGKVIVNGVFAPVVGRISMDWTILDVTDVQNVKVNDEVILIGEQNNLKITAEDLAKIRSIRFLMKSPAE